MAVALIAWPNTGWAGMIVEQLDGDVWNNLGTPLTDGTQIGNWQAEVGNAAGNGSAYVAAELYNNVLNGHPVLRFAAPDKTAGHSSWYTLCSDAVPTVFDLLRGQDQRRRRLVCVRLSIRRANFLASPVHVH